MTFSSKKIENQAKNLLQENLSEQEIQKKTNALESFSEWLRGKSLLKDKEYKKVKQELDRTKTSAHILHMEQIQQENTNEHVREPKSPFNKTNITISLISIGACIFLFSVYYIYTTNKETVVSSVANMAADEGRVLHYRGKLTKSSLEVIDTKTDVIFKLYYSAEDASPIYIGSCIGEDGIVPNYLGYFSVLLGSDCGMKKVPEKLFTSGGEIYLGVTIADGEELKPRQLISKVSYAMNSDKLKGMSLGGSTSNIPFIDKNGVLLINAASPTIQSNSGTFSLEGQSINFKTAVQTGGSIFFTPDFGGNTIIATGNLGVGTLTPTAKLDVKGDASISGNLQFTEAQSYINVLNGGNLTFATSDAGNDAITPRMTLTSNGNVGVGTVNPNSMLSAVQTMKNGSVVSFTNNAKDNEKNTNVLRLGLGSIRESTNPQFVSFYAEATNDNDGTKVGGITLNNGNVAYETTGADFAEYFKSKQALAPGYVVTYKKDGVEKSTSVESAIGVVSDTPGFIGNSSQLNEQQVIVGLMGQIYTFVSTINGDIHVGDVVTTSDIPGYAGTASNKGMPIGIALEDFTANASNIQNCPEEFQTISCGKIKVLINPSWQKSSLAMQQNGEMSSKYDIKKVIVTSDENSNNHQSITSQKNLINEAIPFISQAIRKSFENSSLYINTITTNSIQAIQGSFDSLTAKEIVSPIITAENIKTTTLDVKKITAKQGDIEVDLNPAQTTPNNKTNFAKMVIKGIDDKVVSSLDAQGNATFSGEVQAETITAESASISGTLVAKEVQADNIDSIENKVDTLESSLLTNTSLTDSLKEESVLLTSRLTEIQNELKNTQVSQLPSPAYYQNLQNTQISTTSSLLAQNNTGENLTLTGKINTYNANVSQALTVGQLYMEDTGIRSLSWNLNLSALSTINFFDGMVSVTKDGTLTAKGVIVAEAGIRTSKLSITANNNEVVLNPADNLNKNGTHIAALETNGESAGNTHIPEQQKEIIIYNPRLTSASLIYLTNTSPTITAASNYLAVLEKNTCEDKTVSNCKPYFKVVTDKSLEVPTYFNWLIIN